jgi:hypothetical protein
MPPLRPVIGAVLALTALVLLGGCAADSNGAGATSSTSTESVTTTTSAAPDAESGAAGVPQPSASTLSPVGPSSPTGALPRPSDQSTFASLTAKTTPSRLSPPSTTAAGARVTVVGTVEDGVEPSCLILTDEKTGRRYNVMGGDRAVVKIGARVKVVGVIRTDMMSFCQQGQILQALQASKA